MIVSESCSLSALSSLMRIVCDGSISVKAFGIRAKSTTRDIAESNVSEQFVADLAIVAGLVR